jgi:hypothetical protein
VHPTTATHTVAQATFALHHLLMHLVHHSHLPMHTHWAVWRHLREGVRGSSQQRRNGYGCFPRKF